MRPKPVVRALGVAPAAGDKDHADHDQNNSDPADGRHAFFEDRDRQERREPVFDGGHGQSDRDPGPGKGCEEKEIEQGVQEGSDDDIGIA